MLYVFHGTDIKKSAEKAHTLIDSLRAKRPDAAFEKMTADDWSPEKLESHLGGQGLFSNKYIVFLDRILENSDAVESLPEFFGAMQESSNIFIVLEGKLNAELKKAVEKNAEKAVASDLPVAAKKFGSEFNIFALADAVGARDAVKSWSIYRQAIDNGQESEAILGTLFWQVKSMMLSAGMASAAQAGLSPFVFSKSRRAATNYSAEELKQLSADLITLYHDGHRGMCDLELAVEERLLIL